MIEIGGYSLRVLDQRSILLHDFIQQVLEVDLILTK
jgi:hypothetical protein